VLILKELAILPAQGQSDPSVTMFRQDSYRFPFAGYKYSPHPIRYSIIKELCGVEEGSASSSKMELPCPRRGIQYRSNL